MCSSDLVDPRSPEAYTALAGVQQVLWDWSGSEASYRKAIEVDPKWPLTYRRYGGLLIQFGRFEEGFALIHKGLELDPYDYPSQSAYGLCLFFARRYQEAEKQLKWTLARKDMLATHDVLGELYAAMGKEAQGKDGGRYFDLALSEAEAVRAIETRGNAGETGVTSTSDYMFAVIYAMRGDEIGRAHV